MSDVIAFIFARGGSKGLPGKNIKELAGKPLIAWSIEVGLKTPSIDRVIVSTDSDEIAAIARKFGAEVPFLRPVELASDNSPEWLAWQHAVNETQKQEDFDVFVSLPATAPLRSISDIENCITTFKGSAADIVITATLANRSPWFNMVKKNDCGYFELVNKPESEVIRRQDAPVVYDVTTVSYVTSPDFILNNTGVYDGKVGMVEIPNQRAIDIDTEFDFKMAEFFLKE